MIGLYGNELHNQLWLDLSSRFDDPETGFGSFSNAEALYWCIRNLEREVYRGGLEMFFFNSSGELFEETVASLKQIGATKSADILVLFAHKLFVGESPPRDTTLRRAAMNSYDDLKSFENEGQPEFLRRLDEEYCEDPDKIEERLHDYAAKQGLFKN